MAEWGRKEYSKAWPSRRPVWTWTAFFLSLLFFAGLLTLEYEQSWTAAERRYLSDYLKSGARGKASATSTGKYTLLEAVVGKNQRLVMGGRDRAGAGRGRQAGLPAQAESVPVAPHPEVVQVAPPRKPPAQANEQQHFFE